MRHRFIIVGVYVFMFFISTACDKINLPLFGKDSKKKKPVSVMEVKGTLVAKINNIPVTLEDLNAEIEAYNELMAANDRPEAKITTREQKIDYLKNEVMRRTMLYQQALDRGLDRNPEVLKTLEKSKRELLVIELLRQEAQKIEVGSREIEDYYTTYKEQLKEPEERHIREIVVANEQEATDIMIQLLQGADFATLARQRSKSSSSSSGGDLGYIKRGVNKVTQFDNEAFSDGLDVGRISKIFRGPDGWYILKLEAKRGGKQRSLTEMWDDIKKGLTFLKQQETIKDLIGKLSRESKIEVYEGVIK